MLFAFFLAVVYANVDWQCKERSLKNELEHINTTKSIHNSLVHGKYISISVATIAGV